MSVVSNAIVVAMGITSKSIPALIVRATGIVNAMSANTTTFKTPSPALSVVTVAIDTLTVAETGFKAHTGTRADRDNAAVALVGLLKQLHAYVQGLASASPADAETIAQDAAMTLRKTPQRHKSDLAVHQTVSGVVQVVAKTIKGAKAHEWQYSTDGGKTWISTPTTTQSKTSIPGLTPGVLVMYRHAPVTKTGPADWSQPISALVT
jgi:hypothetical protein